MKCKCGHEVQILLSEKGYYIGVLDNVYEPICRTSEYYMDKRVATSALKYGFEVIPTDGNSCPFNGQCFD